jgi:serine/threonine protein kinase
VPSCREQAVALALRSRRTLLQRIAQGLLQALSYCHSRGVAHCGLGPGCVVVNTWKDKDADRLLVKLDNFGLARLYEHPLEDLGEGEKTYVNCQACKACVAVILHARMVCKRQCHVCRRQPRALSPCTPRTQTW